MANPAMAAVSKRRILGPRECGWAPTFVRSI